MTASRPNARGSNSTHLRIYNERTILQHLRRAQKASKADLARSARLTNAAVGAIIHSLEDENLIEEVGKFHAGGRGQPATLLRPNPKGAFALGLHIGPSSFELVLIDFICRPVTPAQTHFYDGTNEEAAINAILEAIQEQLTALTKKERMRLVGIGLTRSCINTARGTEETTVGEALRDTKDLIKSIENQLGLSVLYETEGLAAATAELFFGLGNTCSDFVYIHIGESIGGTLCIDNDIFRGHAGNAGDISLLPTFPGNHAIKDNAKAGITTLQTRASLASLRDQLAAHLGVDATNTPLQDLMRLAPAQTEDWLDDCGTALSFTIGTICNLLDVPVCIIDSKLGADFAGKIASRLIAAADRPDQVPFRADVIVGSYGQNSSAVGAASLPMFEKYTPRQAILTNT
ncbi:MAG: ROK family protein [Rhodobacteraceae bacterium]|nr:ROK family protein [Paracoccaceae bacterium]